MIEYEETGFHIGLPQKISFTEILAKFKADNKKSLPVIPDSDIIKAFGDNEDEIL